jgi:hypothetical protein
VALSIQTANQTWVDGTAANLVLPGGTFTDALGLKMTFAAYEVSGPILTSWLRFSPATDTFNGSIPVTESGTIGLAVLATDARNMLAVDMFTVTFAPASSHVTAGAPVSGMPLPALESLSGLIALHS